MLALLGQVTEPVSELERALKLVSNYGVTLVIAVLAIALVVVICYLGLKQIPRLVTSTIDSQSRVATAVEGLSETMGTASKHLGDVRRDTQALRDAGEAFIDGAIKGLKPHKDKLPSDVFEQFEESKKILRQQGFQT